jgi:hypothetical protein
VTRLGSARSSNTAEQVQSATYRQIARDVVTDWWRRMFLSCEFLWASGQERALREA